MLNISMPVMSILMPCVTDTWAPNPPDAKDTRRANEPAPTVQPLFRKRTTATLGGLFLGKRITISNLTLADPDRVCEPGTMRADPASTAASVLLGAAKALTMR